MEIITADYIKFLQKKFHEAEYYNRANTISGAITEIDFLLKKGCIYLKNTQNALTIPLGGKMELGYYTYNYTNTGVVYNFKPVVTIHSIEIDSAVKKIQKYYAVSVQADFSKELIDSILSHYKDHGFEAKYLSGTYISPGTVCTYEDDFIRISWDNPDSEGDKSELK